MPLFTFVVLMYGTPTKMYQIIHTIQHFTKKQISHGNHTHSKDHHEQHY